MSADGWNCCRRHTKSTADGLLAIRRVLYVGDGEYNLDSARKAIADALLLEDRRFDDRDFYKFVVLNVMLTSPPKLNKPLFTPQLLLYSCVKSMFCT